MKVQKPANTDVGIPAVFKVFDLWSLDEGQIVTPRVSGGQSGFEIVDTGHTAHEILEKTWNLERKF